MYEKILIIKTLERKRKETISKAKPSAKEKKEQKCKF